MYVNNDVSLKKNGAGYYVGKYNGVLIMTEKQKLLIYSCTKNAEDLINAAKTTLNSNLPNIAFHLSVLAIEEIGKACLIRSSTIALRKEGWLHNRFDDHCEKLYWA